jgi:predicted nucleic acid-binding protein
MAETLERSCICSITWAEAMTGVQTLVSGKRQDALMKFLVDTIQKNYEIIPFNSSCAMVYAHLVKGLKERGRLGSAFDMMIVACAIANNLILVTRNVADFVPITEIAPLMVENWFG